jgi:DNA-binding HxlR family transcriptional regulator
VAGTGCQNSRDTYDREVGTRKCHTYTRVTMELQRMARTKKATRKVVFVTPRGATSTAEVDEIVLNVIGRVADKWTMCVLEVLNQHGTLRFTRIVQLVGGVSQRMLTKTLRQMERDGFVSRKVYPEVPPKVEYKLTELGSSLCGAFCSVWTWAEEHQAEFAELRTGRAKE